jgi:hypothetical protein
LRIGLIAFRIERRLAAGRRNQSDRHRHP